MQRSNHNNSILQNSFNKYGENNFEIQIVEVVNERELLTQREAFWADYHDVFACEKGFNITPIKHNQANDAGNFKHAESVYGDKNGNSKLNNERIISICNELNGKYEGKNKTLKEIGDNHDVTYKAVSNIRDGRTWGHLSQFYLRKEIIDKWPEKNKRKWFSNDSPNIC